MCRNLHSVQIKLMYAEREVGKTKGVEEFDTFLLVVLWELRDSNPRPSACKADALNQLS